MTFQAAGQGAKIGIPTVLMDFLEKRQILGGGGEVRHYQAVLIRSR